MTAVAATHSDGTARTLCPETLNELLLDVGGDEVVFHRFIDDFLTLWPDRLARLRHAVIDADAEQVDELLLSMRCSARMLGALALSTRAEQVRMQVRDGSLTIADVPVREIAELGSGGCRALAAARSDQAVSL